MKKSLHLVQLQNLKKKENNQQIKSPNLSAALNLLYTKTHINNCQINKEFKIFQKIKRIHKNKVT